MPDRARPLTEFGAAPDDVRPQSVITHFNLPGTATLEPIADANLAA